MPHLEEKPILYLPFGLLPEAKDWRVGQVYRVKLVIKQRSLDEDSASFEIVDASSLEINKKNVTSISSDGGSYRG